MKLSEFQEQLRHARDHYQSYLTVVCMDCKRFIQFKDGEGTEGITSGLCPACGSARAAEMDENAIIADNMRDVWRHQQSHAE